MAAIRERTSASGKRTYHVQVRKLGFPPLTKTFSTRTAARSWAQQIEAEMELGSFHPEWRSKKRTVRDLLTRYKAEVLAVRKPERLADQGPQVDWWIEQLGDYSLSELTPSAIAKARDRLSTTPFGRSPARLRSPATIVRYLAVLSHAFNVARKEWQWLSKSPLDMVSKPRVRNSRERFLSGPEIARLRDALAVSDNSQLSAIFEVALSTGMRKGELLGLRWRDVTWIQAIPADPSQGQVAAQHCLLRLTRTKNGDSRTVPLIGAGFRELQRLHQSLSVPDDEIQEMLIFANNSRSVRPIDIKRSWATALRRANITDFRFHDIRHTTASHLAMQGCSLREIAEVLGHRTLAMVKRYSHLSVDHLVDVVKRLDKSPIGS